MQTNTTKNKAFFEWVDTPLYKEWIYTFTGSWRMRLQYNPDDVDLSWTNEALYPETGKLDALDLIYRNAKISKFPWIKLKHLISGTFRLGSTEVGQFEGNIPLIRTTDMVTPTTLNLDTILYVRSCLDEQLLRDGDLLFVNKGSVKKTYFHNAELYPGKYTFFKNQNRARFDSNKMIAKFGYYFAQSQNFLDFVEVSSSTTTVPGVNSTKYANMFMPVPSLSEQRKIVDFLDKESEFIDNVIKSSEVMIEQVEEFSSSMITNLVTGRIPLETFKSVNLTDLKEIDESKYDLTVKLYDQESNSL